MAADGTYIAPAPAEEVLPPIKPRLLRHGYIGFLSVRSLDGRSRAAQRIKELVRALTTDLGGESELTTAQAQLVQRAALLGAALEDWECRHAAGQPIELPDYLAAINTQRRLLATLGLERRQRPVGSPTTLGEYLRAARAADAIEGAAVPVEEEPGHEPAPLAEHTGDHDHAGEAGEAA
jgi:hypothetical protein